jgi:anti-sigma factor RsiW
MTPSPNASETDRLLRYLAGEMSPDEERRLEQSLAADASLRERLNELRALQHTVESAEGRFDDGFAARVMDRVRDARPVASFDEALQAAFLRVAMAALLLIVSLGGYNVATTDEPTGSAVEAALALPDATLGAAAHDSLVPILSEDTNSAD